MTSNEIQLVATSTMGLEAIVARELTELGFAPQNIEVGRTLFTTEKVADICRANIHLRCAGHVLIRMGEFPAVDFGELFDRTTDLPWERWLPRNAAFPVAGRSVKSGLTSVPACQKIVKKAIVNRLQKAYNTPVLPEDGPQFPIEVSLLKDRATLTIDTSGDGLHRRGYKKLIGSAPLRETIAAALVLLSYWNRERPMMDPFCGSGTIPIEAAYIGRNIAPGIRRSFISETWDEVPYAVWNEVRTAARDAVLPPLPVKITASDLDPQAITMARYHAELAGVLNDIEFIQRDFCDITSDQEYGCTIMNPPYGHWIGDPEELESLYYSIPGVLRRLPTWSHYIYTAFPDFERYIGQEATRRRKIYNSRLECTFFQFAGPRPLPEGATEERRKIVPVFGGVSESVQNSAKDFENRLEKLEHHLRRFPTRRGISCYRIYDRDIPEIPLAIDRYEDCLHIAEYERPHDRTAAEQSQWMNLMLDIASRVLDTPTERIFLKQRRRQKGTSQYNRYDNQHFTLQAHEGGLKFLVNLSDYLDTGLFLDHRNTRDMVRREVAGKHFLNLFCYTGAFSVYAADGGAKTVTSVDLSRTYLDWAQDNMELNGFRGSAYEYVRSDVGTFLRALYPDEMFDLAVMDPPTFSNSKDLDDWDVLRDHTEILNLLLQHIVPGGVVYFSTNHRKFRFREEEILGASCREITTRTVPDDFRNKKIHRCWRIVKNGENSSTQEIFKQ